MYNIYSASMLIHCTQKSYNRGRKFIFEPPKIETFITRQGIFFINNYSNDDNNGDISNYIV